MNTIWYSGDLNHLVKEAKNPAIPRFKRLARNLMIDVRFGGKFLGGSIATRFEHLGATETQNTDYTILRYLFRQLIIQPNDVLVDVGSGKGRVLNWWLHMGLRNRLIGIEMDPILAASLRHRLKRYLNVTVIEGNAVEELPADATIFYLFNPFGAEVVASFKRQIEIRCRRPVTLIYYNSVHLEIFVADQRWTSRPVPPPSRPEVKVYDAAICRWKP